jgi:hypothetical protein
MVFISQRSTADELTASRREMSSALLLFCSEVEDEMSSKTAEGKIQF